MIRTYTELIKLDTFEERFRYLKLNGHVSNETFGFDRYLNQAFYRNPKWRDIRRDIIIRDNGCDLGVEGFEIDRGIIIHHMNPITIDDLKEWSQFLVEPEYLICTSLQTHNAIHYGDETFLNTVRIVNRHANDQCPWRLNNYER